jgi:integrase
MTKSRNGTGSVQPRGENAFRLRYRIDGKRFETTFNGTEADAEVKLRQLLGTGDNGTHIEPDKKTVGQWIDEWLGAGAPGQRRKKGKWVSQRTLERYSQLLRTHIKPVLGNRRLQKLQSTEIDKLYGALKEKAEIAPRTQHHVHIVFSALLAAAQRKRLIMGNPMIEVETVPNVEELIIDDTAEESDDYGDGLSESELSALVTGFKTTGIYPVVALGAVTGARRNELLALRWVDLDTEAKAIRIERALEQTAKFGVRVKVPKTKRGKRTIPLDDAIIAVLLKEREKHQRIQAGLPDGADVDLSLIKLPKDALMFPAPPAPDKDISLVNPRDPRGFTKQFRLRCRQIKRGETTTFEGTKFHVLRGVHATALLDAGMPVNRVAELIGDDPMTVLRVYAKKKGAPADKALSDALSKRAGNLLK